jgi:hypothetical protein
VEDDGGIRRLLRRGKGSAEDEASSDSKGAETLTKFRHGYEYSNLMAVQVALRVNAKINALID